MTRMVVNQDRFGSADFERRDRTVDKPITPQSITALPRLEQLRPVIKAARPAP